MKIPKWKANHHQVNHVQLVLVWLAADIQLRLELFPDSRCLGGRLSQDSLSRSERGIRCHGVVWCSWLGHLFRMIPDTLRWKKVRGVEYASFLEMSSLQKNWEFNAGFWKSEGIDIEICTHLGFRSVPLIMSWATSHTKSLEISTVQRWNRNRKIFTEGGGAVES